MPNLITRIEDWFRSLWIYRVIMSYLKAEAADPTDVVCVIAAKIGGAPEAIYDFFYAYAHINNADRFRDFALRYPWFPNVLLEPLALKFGDLNWLRNTPGTTLAGGNLDAVSADIAEKIRSVMANQALREPFEVVGAGLWDAVVGAIQYGGEADSNKAKESARRLIGLVTGMSVAPGLLSTAIETVSFGKIKNAGEAFRNVYWNLGLGFLTWQTLGDLFGATISNPLKEEYQGIYRPNRFSLSQLQDLYGLGYISVDDFRSRLAKLGYRDRDIDYVVALSYRHLSQGDIFDAYNKGLINRNQLELRLRGLGYDPSDISILIELHRPEDASDQAKMLLSTVKNAFKEHFISAGQFRSYLGQMGYSETEIELELQLLSMSDDEQIKTLAVSQVREAYMHNVIGAQEVIKYLTDNDLPIEGIQIMLRTWDIEKAPVVLKLNKTTITQAYRAGVIDRVRAEELLREVGYSAEATTLIMDVEDVTPQAANPKPTLGAIMTAFRNEIIDEETFTRWMTNQGYNEKAITLYRELSLYNPPEKNVTLTKSELLSAYQKNVIGYDECLAGLQALGYDLEDAAILLATYTPKVVLPQTALPSKDAIVAVYFMGYMSDGELTGWLNKLGLTGEATLVIGDLISEMKAGTVAAPYVGSFMQGLLQGLINYEQFIEGMSFYEIDPGLSAYVYTILSYTEKSNTREITKSDIETAIKNETITEVEGIGRLLLLGYDGGDIEIMLSKKGA